MFKKLLLLLTIVFIVAISLFLCIENTQTAHLTISFEDVHEVRFAGESIKNKDKWRDATLEETVQLVEWFNTADYIEKIDNPSTAKTKLSNIIIELKPTKKKNERGEIIMIFNSNSEGFEVHRDDDTYYIAAQINIKEFLNGLEEE